MTNTSRFYHQSEIEKYNCKYLKFQCRGHGETPSAAQTDTFIKLVYNFISQNPLSCIGVHCTHGFNRTGFLIASYLVLKADCSVQVAMDMFSEVRPPGIYKQDYIQELYKRYDDINDAPTAPDLPDWCFADEDVQIGSGNSTSSESYSGSSTS